MLRAALTAGLAIGLAAAAAAQALVGPVPQTSLGKPSGPAQLNASGGLTLTGTMTSADANIAGSGPIAGAFTTSNPVPTAQNGTLGASPTATVRIKRLPGRVVSFNVQMSIPNVGSGTGTANLALPFTLASGVTCFGSGRELISNGKHVDFYIGGGGSSGSMFYYDGTATLVAGQAGVLFVVVGECETAN